MWRKCAKVHCAAIEKNSNSESIANISNTCPKPTPRNFFKKFGVFFVLDWYKENSVKDFFKDDRHLGGNLGN